MSESTQSAGSSRYFKLGLFMLIGIALIVAGVILLGAGSLFQKSILCETFVNESVNGLDVGAAVKYRGVTIGKVSAIQFASTKYGLINSKDESDPSTHAIVLEMSLQPKTFNEMSQEEIDKVLDRMVARGMRARVTTAGIAGQSYVELDFLDPKAYPTPKLSWKPMNMYIPSAPSAIGEVMDAAERISMQLQKVDLAKMVQHYDDLATNASATVNSVKTLLADNHDKIDATLNQLPSIAKQLNSTAARASAIVNDPRVDHLITSLSATSESANVAMLDIRRLSQEAEALLSGQGDDLRAIIADLRRLAENGAAITEDARQNPSRTLFGAPPERRKSGE